MKHNRSMIYTCVPWKPHHFRKEYRSISNGDDGRPIMWRIKLMEGKDCPKLASGKRVLPSKFEGTNTNTDLKYTKTSTFKCEMMEPIHGKGKCVSMDSAFWVTVGVLLLHDLKVFIGLPTRKQRHWLKGDRGGAYRPVVREEEAT